MKVLVTPRVSRDGSKIFYSFEWGKKSGQRITTGVFTYAHPDNAIQKRYNVEALQLVEVKKSQVILDALSIGTDFVPAYKYQHNFLDFYKDYVKHHQRAGNRHLECSYNQFKQFIKVSYISSKEINEEVSAGFQRYLLRRFNGETIAQKIATHIDGHSRGFAVWNSGRWNATGGVLNRDDHRCGR